MKQTKLKSGCSAQLLHRIKLEGLRRQKFPSNVPSVAVLLPLAWVASTGSNNDKGGKGDIAISGRHVRF